jgi:hypothetical protein
LTSTSDLDRSFMAADSARLRHDPRTIPCVPSEDEPTHPTR